jgi:hypothetical protein
MIHLPLWWTNPERIQDLALQKLVVERLRERPMKDDLKQLRKDKEELCKLNLKKAKLNKTPDWSMDELEIVLKYLKKGASRDPDGYANELFHPNVAGKDLKFAILKLMNRMKKESVYPECFQMCNITSLYKRKGPKNNFDSYRGIFRTHVFRNILDRLMYNSAHSKIDAKLTDCNVGSRKGRNIRDHIFVLNAIMNAVNEGNEEAVDAQVYDIKECFDSLWLNEVINDLYDAGLDNDMLPLIFHESKTAAIAVKTSGGISRRITTHNIIMQGTVWAGLCCTVLMDKLGQLLYSRPDLLYLYKGSVPIPCLQMVDDVLGVAKCSGQSIKVNTVVNSFIETKKLTMKTTKCHNIHIGSMDEECSNLKVHNDTMDKASSTKYLGDVLDKSGKTKATIAERNAKGFGITAEVLAITSHIPLGQWRVPAGLLLRQAMLVNGSLYNSESWQGREIPRDTMALEKPDEALLRGLLGAHSKVPIEFLYLECGITMVRHILASRRMIYLQNILKTDPTEMLRKVYTAQKADPKPGDFCELVTADFSSMEINLSDKDITDMKTSEYKKYIKYKVRTAAFQNLKQQQQKHSKVKHIVYKTFKVQPYIVSSLFTKDDISTLVSLRSRTVRGIRSDFSHMYNGDILCPVCGLHDDTLPALLTCPRLVSQLSSTGKVTDRTAKYNDIFHEDVRIQKAITSLYIEMLEIRDKMMRTPEDTLVTCTPALTGG